MKNISLKVFLLVVSLLLPLSLRPTWVGTIATAYKPNVTIGAAVAGALAATIYAGTHNTDEHEQVRKWSQTAYGKWFLHIIGAYHNPKRALYAYRLFTILAGTLTGTVLGYGIAYYFSSERAAALVQSIVGAASLNPLIADGPALNTDQIIDRASGVGEFPLNGALGEIRTLKGKVKNAQELSANVLNNNKAAANEKALCQSFSEAIKNGIQLLTGEEKTILKDPQFKKELQVMAQ